MAPKKLSAKAAAKAKAEFQAAAKAGAKAAPKKAAVAPAPAPKPPLVEVPDDDKEISRNEHSRVLMHLGYKSDPAKNKSGEGLAEAQKALQAHQCFSV